MGYMHICHLSPNTHIYWSLPLRKVLEGLSGTVRLGEFCRQAPATRA